MNHADLWTKRTLKHVRVLAKGIGPRSATSDGERRAAEYVRAELQRLGLSEVRLETFQGAATTWLIWAIAFSIAAWAMLVGLLLGWVGRMIALLLYLTAAWIIYRELVPSLRSGNHPLRRRLWRGDSQNALGVVPPTGSVERQVVLMSYLDSARTPFVWRTHRRRRLAGWLALPAFFSLPLGALAMVLLVRIAVSNFFFFFFALFVLSLLIIQIAALIIASIQAERSPFGPGANNNASGVATMLSLAERLKQTPLTHTKVWLLATGCRETGGDGIRAFLKKHGSTLREATFIALEGVGVGERVVFLSGEGPLGSTSYSIKALATATQAAEHCRTDGLEISAERHRGGPTEMGLITQGGFKGVTVNVWPEGWSGVAGRRRMDDDLGSIEKQALAQAHTFVWIMLQTIDANLSDPKLL